MQSPKSPLVSPCQHLPTVPIRGLAWPGSLECGFKSKPHGAIAAVRRLTTWLAGLDHSSPLLAPQLGFGRRDATGAEVLNVRKSHLRQARCRPSPLDAVSNHTTGHGGGGFSIFIPFVSALVPSKWTRSRPWLTSVCFENCCFTRYPPQPHDGIQVRNSR